jgi:hypothetical protein
MQAVIIGLGLFYGYRNKRLSDGGIWFLFKIFYTVNALVISVLINKK